MMVGGLVGLYETGALFSRSPVVIGVQVAAVLLMVWARVTFGARSFHAAANPTGGGLVTTGPYRFIRHPIYTAACLIGWAGVAAHWSAASAAFGALLFAGALVSDAVRGKARRRNVSGIPGVREANEADDSVRVLGARSARFAA